MLLSLGQFVFGISTLSYQQLQRQTSWRWASNNRVGLRPSKQFLGPGEDSITLSGWIAPELCGDQTSLEQLRIMANNGVPYVLVDATGKVFGLWIIGNIAETGSLFNIDSKARRIDFSVSIKRVDDDQIDQVGMITTSQEIFV